MSTLRNIQQRFYDHILRGDTRVLDAIAPHAIGGDRLAQIYRNNTFISLREALGMHFPVVRKLVAEDYFTLLADGFIREHTPGSPSLYRFGEDFPAFIQRHEVSTHLPYLHDVARLEWLLQLAHQSSAAAALDLNRLGALPEHCHDNLVFHLHAAAGLISSTYPLLEIWQSNTRDNDVRDARYGARDNIRDSAALIDLDRQPGGDKLAVYPDGEAVAFMNLTHAEWIFLQSIAAGAPFLQNCEEAIAVDANFDPGRFLQRCVVNPIIVDFSTQRTSHE